MKEKLLKVREQIYCSQISFRKMNKQDDLDKLIASSAVVNLDESLALLDSIISMLDSPELVENVAKAIYHVARPKGGESIAYKTNITKAKAAIEAIRGDK